MKLLISLSFVGAVILGGYIVAEAQAEMRVPSFSELEAVTGAGFFDDHECLYVQFCSDYNFGNASFCQAHPGASCAACENEDLAVPACVSSPGDECWPFGTVDCKRRAYGKCVSSGLCMWLILDDEDCDDASDCFTV